MKKLFCLLLIIAIAIPAFAEFKVKVEGDAPTVYGPGSDPGVTLFNQEVKEAFDSVKSEIESQIQDLFPNSPDKLLHAMANSSVYSSHGATTRGYAGYKLFTATVGPTFGVQLPNGLSSVVNDIGNLSETIERDHDIKLGVSPNLFNLHFGLSMGAIKILPEHLGLLKKNHLYFGIRFGYFNLPSFSGLSFSSFTLGLTANYQIIPNISLAGLVKWRGINIGTGFIYNSNKLGFTMNLDSIDQGIGTGSSRVHMEPDLSVKLDISTYTIPLEAVTAIKLLIFNIPFGIGADLAFGSTSLGFGVDSDIKLNNLPNGYTDKGNGNVSVKASAKNSPNFFNFKIITGFGIHAGPVVFDIPITYYPADSYTIGLTVGAVY